LAKRYFKSLNKNWNELLSTLDVRFSVQIGDDTSIRVTFPDGEAPIEDLSGGERCCAALAFIMAVNRQFASSAGFLILDEPTYGLDADHRDKLLDLLKSARTYTDSSGLQLMMITHEDGLRGGFNNLIDLNP
jgi:DNA repair exonuclease SbcCD ATPase subunit